MSRRTKTSRHDGGFTLLELLISLALLSLLTLALYGSLNTGTRVWAASEATTTTDDDIRAAQQQLSTAISTAYPKVVVADAAHASIVFDGEPTSLSLLIPDPNLTGGFVYATIGTQKTRSDTNLVLARRSELAAAPSRATSHVLLSGLSGFEFRYLGSENKGDRPAWHERWINQTRPPELVRVRATFVDRRLSWPDLVVRPEIQGDVSCTFDTLTKECQG